MEFKKVLQKDKDGKDVEVIKQISEQVEKRERVTTLDEQENRLELLKRIKQREMKRWDEKIAVQRQRLIECSKALGVSLDVTKLDAEPEALEEEEQPVTVGGAEIPKPEKTGKDK